MYNYIVYQKIAVNSNIHEGRTAGTVQVYFFKKGEKSMNLKDRMILEEFRKCREDYVQLGDTVRNLLKELIENANMTILGIEHRVKTEKSLAGKLERRGDYYQQLTDLTDLLGARVICFFADEVDIVGKMVEECFRIDWDSSSDKRALIKADAFGYLSLHYICYLTPDMGYPENICNKKFEIQIRTNLQHTWAAICHDLGYKSEFGVPRVVTRQFARLAGLLELADDEFVRVRENMTSYTEDIRRKIIMGCADDVMIDMISLSEYIRRNIRMVKFLDELAAISGAEINEVNPESYIEQLAWFGIRTLGDMQNMMEQNHDPALKLAKHTLENTDLDILASHVGLRYLCRAKLMNDGRTMEDAVEFLTLATGNKNRAERQAASLFRTWQSIQQEEV